MKKIFLLVAIIICAAEIKACDICGCGAGNSYIGILPDFHRHIFGVRYRYNFLRTHIGAGGADTYLTTNEKYKTAEVWSGWNIGKKFRLMAIVPYNFDERHTLTASESKNGIGDISVAGYYQLLNKKTNLKSKLLVQSLWLGAGIKLPTGSYESPDKTGAVKNANLFQLGTASTDFSFNVMYDVRLNDAGINIAANYKINTANKDRYEYGNKLSVAAQGYYKFLVKNKLLIAPNAGVQFESSQKDLDKGFYSDLSGGHLLTGSAGVELSYGKIAVGANMQTPFSQNLASGFIKAQNRGMVHVGFML